MNPIKFLGVILLHDLSWARHIDSVCMTAKHRVGFLYRQFHLAGPSCLTQLYKSLVVPILDYCSCVWDPNYTLYIDKLESVQKFATKVILRDWNSCYNDRMKLLYLPLLSIRCKRQKLSLCYRIVTGRSIIPPSLFTPHPCPSLRHAHHMPLYYPRFRTTSHQASFYVSVIPLWNTLITVLVDRGRGKWTQVALKGKHTAKLEEGSP